MKKMYHKAPLLIACVLVLTCTGCLPEESAIPGKNAVKQLDVERLMGTWHEVAQWGRPDRKMIAALKIETYIDDIGLIRLVIKKNKYTPYGPLTVKKGKAKWEADNPGVFKCSVYMNFFKKYYILYLDTEYTATLICNREATKLMIFSKYQSLSESQMAGIIQTMKTLGFDPEKLNWHQIQF